MKIIVESHIPFISGILENAGHSVTYLPPEEITAKSVREADALIVRTRTRCDSQLLDGSKVSLIATATIGTDHIDLDYCRRRGIRVSNAPGCNAPAVAQYVLSAIGRLRPGLRPTIGIVGVGHVGSTIKRWAGANDFPTLLCDTPLGMPATLADIAANADIITFHTPLDETTRHMADAAFFAACRRRPIVINAARGPVVETGALIDALKAGSISDAVIDCWENEPRISAELLDLAAIATPHIAGYSIQGKRRATAMALHAIDPSIDIAIDPVAPAPTLDEITASYDPLADTNNLRANPAEFEALRNGYAFRKEPE